MLYTQVFLNLTNSTWPYSQFKRNIESERDRQMGLMGKLNQGKPVTTKAKTVPGLETKIWMPKNPGEEVVGEPDSTPRPWFEPKKGSVIPPKRKLVKRMMLDYILNSFASLICCGDSLTSATNAKKKKKKKNIFPDSAQPGNASSGYWNNDALFFRRFCFSLISWIYLTPITSPILYSAFYLYLYRMDIMDFFFMFGKSFLAVQNRRVKALCFIVEWKQRKMIRNG